MRRLLGTLTVLLLLVGSGAAALAPDAGAAAVAPKPSAAAAHGGTFVATGPARVLDTRSGVGHRGAVRAGHVVALRVAGRGGVPASGAGAVVVAVTAVSPSGTGALTVFPHGSARPRTTNVSFTAHGVPTTDTLVVGLGRGLVDIASTATTQVFVDVLGYFRAGAGAGPGAFHPVVAKRAANTVLGARRTLALRLVGGAGIAVPADAVGAVAATITVVGPARTGTLLAYRAGEQQSLPSVNFTAHRSVSTFAVLRVSGGRVLVQNTASASVRVHVDVAGYFGVGFAQDAGTFQTRVPTRVALVRLAAGRSAVVKVAGSGGVERTGVAAVLVSLHATSSSAGSVQAWRAGTRRPTSAVALSSPAGAAASNEVLVPLANGRFAVRNGGKHSMTLTVDVGGYVRGSRAVVPASHAVARYLADLTEDVPSDATAMDAHGCSDARTGPTFVLLDVGAQSVTGPELSTAHPGVSLANTSAIVRLTYSQLTNVLDAYLGGFARCHIATATPTIAVATNNDGVWDAKDPAYYSPGGRGRDWATRVIALLAAHAASIPLAVHVVAADDIEPHFVSTEAQAQAWEDALRNVTPGFGTALVFVGSADGCPPTWSTAGSCDFGWRKRQLSQLAGGPRTVALPQVFSGASATQWAEIDAAGGGHLRFLGELTETAVDATTLTAAQAYLALSSALRAVGGAYALKPPARPDIIDS